ncbi:MAG: hypothetical protein IT370_32510 [Deltaproteobacteria bacterium]|nr:hypothetical protein [Deltaproteobacteria bacterium]
MRWPFVLTVALALALMLALARVPASAGPRPSPIAFSKVQVRMPPATTKGFVAVAEVSFTATLREPLEPRFVLGGTIKCVDTQRELNISLGNLARVDELRLGKPFPVRQAGPDPATPVARNASCRLRLRLEDTKWTDEPHIDLVDFCFKAGASKTRVCP